MFNVMNSPQQCLESLQVVSVSPLRSHLPQAIRPFTSSVKHQQMHLQSGQTSSISKIEPTSFKYPDTIEVMEKTTQQMREINTLLRENLRRFPKNPAQERPAHEMGSINEGMLHYSPKPFNSTHKNEFPVFDGSNPRLWTRNCKKYFVFYDIAENRKVSLASLYMVGKAKSWVYCYMRVRVNLDWDEFIMDLYTEFKDNSGSNGIREYDRLQQIGSREMYLSSFDDPIGMKLQSIPRSQKDNLQEWRPATNLKFEALNDEIGSQQFQGSNIPKSEDYRTRILLPFQVFCVQQTKNSQSKFRQVSPPTMKEKENCEKMLVMNDEACDTSPNGKLSIVALNRLETNINMEKIPEVKTNGILGKSGKEAKILYDEEGTTDHQTEKILEEQPIIHLNATYKQMQWEPMTTKDNMTSDVSKRLTSSEEKVTRQINYFSLKDMIHQSITTHFQSKDNRLPFGLDYEALRRPEVEKVIPNTPYMSFETELRTLFGSPSRHDLTHSVLHGEDKSGLVPSMQEAKKRRASYIRASEITLLFNWKYKKRNIRRENFFGSITIIGEVAFQLKLPEYSKVYPVFHICQLKEQYDPPPLHLRENFSQVILGPAVIIGRKCAKHGTWDGDDLWCADVLNFLYKIVARGIESEVAGGDYNYVLSWYRDDGNKATVTSGNETLPKLEDKLAARGMDCKVAGGSYNQDLNWGCDAPKDSLKLDSKLGVKLVLRGMDCDDPKQQKRKAEPGQLGKAGAGQLAEVGYK